MARCDSYVHNHTKWPKAKNGAPARLESLNSVAEVPGQGRATADHARALLHERTQT